MQTTVVVEPSTSIEIRVSMRLGANPFRFPSRVRDRAAHVLPFSPELRYQLVACRSHLTMLSKVFYVFILSIPGHPAPQTRTKLPNCGLGAPPALRMPQQAHFPLPSPLCGQGSPFTQFFCDEHRVWTTNVTRLKSVLLPYLPYLYLLRLLRLFVT